MRCRSWMTVALKARMNRRCLVSLLLHYELQTSTRVTCQHQFPHLLLEELVSILSSTARRGVSPHIAKEQMDNRGAHSSISG